MPPMNPSQVFCSGRKTNSPLLLKNTYLLSKLSRSPNVRSNENIVCILDSGAYALKQFDLGRIFSATSVLISSNV
ncbi:unnamed protein product [Brassica napus]|uniref:(rape) hypothetical protein n=1 Tax=Brassica napus TaxID=3708 RepID=A0A816VFD9_BRANA|nr:unnamed protein product [Brassica napus]